MTNMRENCIILKPEIWPNGVYESLWIEVEQKVFELRQLILYIFPVGDFQGLILKCQEIKKILNQQNSQNCKIQKVFKCQCCNLSRSWKRHQHISTMNNIILQWIFYELRQQATKWLWFNGVVVKRTAVAPASTHCSLWDL